MLGLSILHLLEDKEEVIAKGYKMLKPGGVFITSTVCLGDTMKIFKVIAPIGKFFGLLPILKGTSKNSSFSGVVDLESG